MNRQDGPLLVGAVDQLTPGKIVPLLRNAAGELIVTSGGASGSTVDLISVGGSPIAIGQAAMAASLPVVIASDQSPIPITGTISATNPSVDATGGAVPSDATYIGINIGGNLTGPVGGHGTAAGALRVELPTDGTGVIAGVTTVSAVTAVTSITNPVTVVQATGTSLHTVVDSGTITAVTSITNPVTVAQATATSLKAEVIGAGTAGTANAGVVTVQGIAAMTPLLVTPAANSAVNLAQLDGNTVSTGNGGTGTGVLRVAQVNDGTGVLATVTNVATIGTSVTPGTAAANLGKAEDSGHTTADVGVFALAVRQDSPDTAVTNTTADYSQVSVSSTGALRNAPMSEDFAALANGPQVKKYYANTGAVTDGIVWSPASGKRWYVTDLVMTTSAAATVTFEDDKAGGDEIVLAGDFAANSGLSSHFQTPLYSGEDAADLLVTTSAGNIKITITGYEI